MRLVVREVVVYSMLSDCGKDHTSLLVIGEPEWCQCTCPNKAVRSNEIT